MLCRVPSSAGGERVSKGATGVFFCYALPALDQRLESSPWRRARLTGISTTSREEILEGPGEIVASIRSQPNTPRECSEDEPTLHEIRAKVHQHIKNTYLKRLDAPVGAP